MPHSPGLRSSARHRSLLRRPVDRSQARDPAALKDSVIAVEVFGRPAARFDPRQDRIVRVETRRLHARLMRYFDTEGRSAPWQIALPVGSYVPAVCANRPNMHRPAWAWPAVG